MYEKILTRLQIQKTNITKRGARKKSAVGGAMEICNTCEVKMCKDLCQEAKLGRVNVQNLAYFRER